MTFSEFVISVRRKLKLSQKQLATAINVSYSTINDVWKAYEKQYTSAGKFGSKEFL